MKYDIDFWEDMCWNNWKFWLVSPLVLVAMIVLGVLQLLGNVFDRLSNLCNYLEFCFQKVNPLVPLSDWIFKEGKKK
jgi:hypothetical protein